MCRFIAVCRSDRFDSRIYRKANRRATLIARWIRSVLIRVLSLSDEQALCSFFRKCRVDEGTPIKAQWDTGCPAALKGYLDVGYPTNSFWAEIRSSFVKFCNPADFREKKQITTCLESLYVFRSGKNFLEIISLSCHSENLHEIIHNNHNAIIHNLDIWKWQKMMTYHLRNVWKLNFVSSVANNWICRWTCYWSLMLLLADIIIFTLYSSCIVFCILLLIYVLLYRT